MLKAGFARICLTAALVALAVLPGAAAAADAPVRLQPAPGVPQFAADAVLRALTAAGVNAELVAAGAAGTDLRLGAAGSLGEGAVIAAEHTLTPVARLSSTLDGITPAELRAVWTGAGKSANFARIHTTAATADALAALLGAPGANVKIVAPDKLDAAVWGDKAGIGVVPFDALTVRLRALRVDGRTPIDNRFDAAKWPLTYRAALAADTDRGRAGLDAARNLLPATDRDPKKLTVVAMTGVTAMARQSAVAIERARDWGFLARKIGPELAAADITTVSNEIPFMPGCVANGGRNVMAFCSKPEYWENLALSGVDAVGLTGNHVLDFGRKALLYTLSFYEDKKIPVYGGGANEKAAAEPLVLEHNGNRIAFIGANPFGPASVWAGPDKPGSARFNSAQMQAAIRNLEPKVDVIFAELQHAETDYKGDYVNVPNRQAEIDFRALSDAGADVVTGIMAHAPQALETRKGKLILYGLGNLYFDQTWSWPTRTGLVARHTIYDGRLINTELLVTIIDKNFQLRFATPAERGQVLKSLFDVSRW